MPIRSRRGDDLAAHSWAAMDIRRVFPCECCCMYRRHSEACRDNVLQDRARAGKPFLTPVKSFGVSDQTYARQALSNAIPGGGQTPVVQTVTNLISMATNPIQLMKMSEVYLPWY